MRGESTIAVFGAIAGGLIVVSLLASGVWSARKIHESQVAARQDCARAVTELLTPAAEAMLSQGELSPLRRVVMDTAQRHGLSRCRIVGPGGVVLADHEPERITADLDQVDWQAPVPPAGEELAVFGGHTRSVTVPGKGQARVEVIAPQASSSAWGVMGGFVLVALLAGLGWALAYRRFRARLATMGQIREALLAISDGETAEAAVTIAEDLGSEARAWNQMLIEHRHLRQQVMVRHAREAMSAAGSVSGDLAGGCDAMSQGVILLDERIRVVFTNNAAATFLGTSRKELLGTALTQWGMPAEVREAIVAAAESGRRSTHVIDRREAGGSDVLRFSMRPVRRSDEATALVLIEDITQQRVAEDARHEFVAQATHELRTPLTNIRLYLETLIDDGDKDAKVRAECLNVITQETRRLERMVSDMLSVAEIEAGSLKVNPDDVRLDQLVHEIEQDYRAAAKEKQIELEFHLPPKLPVLQADREKISMALHNLLGNAIKYTNEGGRINVTIELHDEEVTIDVTDTGIGISPQHLPHVFERFYRAADDKRVTAVTGTGLGLALAREVARLHGGDITVESQVDQGTTFTLTLPIAAETATTATE